MSRIDEIRERVEKASPGPWSVKEEHRSSFYGEGIYYAIDPMVVVVEDTYDDQPAGTYGGVNGCLEAELIANAPDDIAYLLDTLTRLQARCEAAEAVAEAATSVQEDKGPYHSTESAYRLMKLDNALHAWQEVSGDG